jgi:hypothetical protein
MKGLAMTASGDLTAPEAAGVTLRRPDRRATM